MHAPFSLARTQTHDAVAALAAEVSGARLIAAKLLSLPERAAGFAAEEVAGAAAEAIRVAGPAGGAAESGELERYKSF
jgi:hypothetical protein